MSELTYTSYNKKSLLVHGDREKYGNKLKEIGGRWNTRVKGGPGWTVPSSREGDLKRLIVSLQKEEKVEIMRSHAKPVREQKKYHRAVSESDTESDFFDSEEEKESERESEKESYRVKPIAAFDDSEKIKPVESSLRVRGEPSSEVPKEKEISRKGGRGERSNRPRPAYSSESEEEHPPSRKLKPVSSRNEKDVRDLYRRTSEERHRHKSPAREHRHKSPARELIRPKGERPARGGFERSPRRRRSPSLTSDSESEYSSSEDDLPSPHSPVKRKTREDLERGMRRKIKALERQVEEIRFEKRRHHRR